MFNFKEPYEKCKKTKVLDQIFLFYSWNYQISFGHFMSNCVPKLYEYIKLKNKNPLLKIGIPLKRYSLICKNLLSLFNINNDDIIIFEYDVIYNINKLYTIKHFDTFNTICDSKLFTYNFIRTQLKIKCNNNGTKKIYIKKDNIINIKTDNYEIGITRKILNENIIIDYLKKNGFNIISLGDKNIKEKSDLLNDAHVVITQLGGNCFNLLFSNTPKNILFLSNDTPLGYKYYCDIFQKINYSTYSNISIYKYKSINKNIDKKNKTNSPFVVNINDIECYLKNIN